MTKRKTPGLETLEETLARRRLKSCVERWPEAESGKYDPSCCRFPKSCSPHGYVEAFRAGNITDSDLEKVTMPDLIFLDTETTGLEPELHDVWEIAYAINDGPIEAHILVHSLKTADPQALDLNGYHIRYPAGARSDGPHVDLMVRHLLAGNTIVCANPTFDRMFLRKRWGSEPWKYRSIDVESMALVVFGWEHPRGLKDIADELRSRKHDISVPDHTAAGDVKVLRECYKALRIEVDKYKIY